MGRIQTTGRTTHTFDDSALQATYHASSTDDGGVNVVVDVYEGTALLASIPVAAFGTDEVDGFRQD